MTIQETITQQLRDEILSGQWKVGEKLPSESSLCARFTASRTSIRGALSALSAEGLIETRQGKRSIVQSTDQNSLLSSLSFSQVDLFEFRRIFEMECSYLAALRADEDLLSQMRDCVTIQQNASDPSTVILQDMRFHRLIAVASGNSLFLNVFKMMRPVFWKMFFENVAHRGNEGCREHLSILAAIEARDPNRAREYMVDHLNKSMIHKSESSFK